MAVTLTFQLVTPVFAEDTEQANIDTLPQETEVLVDETKGPDETEEPAEADAPSAATETDKQWQQKRCQQKQSHLKNPVH